MKRKPEQERQRWDSASRRRRCEGNVKHRSHLKTEVLLLGGKGWAGGRNFFLKGTGTPMRSSFLFDLGHKEQNRSVSAFAAKMKK